MAWGFPLNAEDDSLHIIPAGNDNTVTFTNSRTGATPTGISVDNLPNIILLGLGLSLLTAFVAIKTHKAKRAEEK